MRVSRRRNTLEQQRFDVLLLAVLMATALSVIITAIFLHTRQSLIPSLLLHGAVNANMGLIYASTSERSPAFSCSRSTRRCSRWPRCRSC
jgi:membrane protease YdiL (CAAX protease family)